MYQYSLEFFTRLFKMRLEKSEQSDDVDKRLEILIDDITRAFYLSICRGLFERDKLLYSFLNTAQILMRAEAITTDEWNFFLRGSTNDYKDKENPTNWLEEKTWISLQGLQDCHDNFKGLVDSITDKGDQVEWKQICQSETPWEIDMPAIFEAKLTAF